MHGTGAPLGRFTHEVPDDAKRAAQSVAAVLDKAKRVLVLGHAGADGDVCGSSLGLAQALRERGKDVVVYNEEPYPEAYRWLVGGAAVVTSIGPDETFDATVVVDAARPDRLGRHFPEERARRGTYVWIDHHRTVGDAPGDLAYVDLTAAAVGEQIAEVLDAMAHPISAEVARCLYASLLADTGGFRYGNTSARAFRLAARLVETGIDPWEMTERIYESQDEARLRLLGRALASLWMSPCGRVGVVEIREDDLASLGARDEHVQGLVNHVRGIKGVEVALLLREAPTGTKVIARSRGNVNIASIVQPLGVLGHKNAASFVLEKPLADARALVVDAFVGALPPVVPLSRAERAEQREDSKRQRKAHRASARPAE
jgi:bifunctional oligoribonuclease and PAP phosphatase NrnA